MCWVWKKTSNATMVYIISKCPQVFKIFYDWPVKYKKKIKSDHFSFKRINSSSKQQSQFQPFILSSTAPGSIPRDLTPVPVEGDPLSVTLNWQPPQKPHGQITGRLSLFDCFLSVFIFSHIFFHIISHILWFLCYY